MKNILLNFLSLVISGFVLSSCQVIGDIFEAGVYSGIFLVALIIGIIIFVITRLSKKK